MKLNVRAFAITSGLLWGVGVFAAAWWVMLWGDGSQAPMGLGSIYRGYDVTPLGSVIGLLWGLLDGWIAGGIFAWLYNRLSGTLK